MIHSQKSDRQGSMLANALIRRWMNRDRPTRRAPDSPPSQNLPSSVTVNSFRSSFGAAASFQLASTGLQCRTNIFDATAREAGAVNDLDDRLALFQ